ncbi:MAG: B12-binding domain-containing radical SAM protein [Acidobacteria bacterium]|nr:B12-binding domain-containing radical SAM protein [Acidobacteriota bacterium]MCB9397697.1 B12-binding domain-containing radical SAM protein [Acidobacteriota bacterium]
MSALPSGKPTKIIFFNPISTRYGNTPLPISLMQLAAQVPNGCDWVLVDGNLEADSASRIRAHAQGHRALLAVTVMPGPQAQHAIRVCKVLKQEMPHLPILWGGYFPTQHPELCLKSGFIDALAYGPADDSFAHYLRNWLVDEPQAVPGILLADDPAPILQKPAYRHPDELPDLPYEKIDMRPYLNTNVLGKRCLVYHSSVGCPFFCSFCAVVDMANGQWKAQSAAKLATNLFALQDRYGMDAVQFFDNNFFVNRNRCAEFADRILQEKRNLAWWGEGRIDTLLNHFPVATLEKMQKAGLKMVFLGAETSDLETMSLFQKGGNLTPDMTLELAGLFKKIGIVPEFSFVLGSPDQPLEKLHQDFEFIRRIKSINPLAEIIIYLYTPVVLPGELNDLAASHGFSYPTHLEEFAEDRWVEFEKRKSATLPWSKAQNHRLILDFEAVIHARFPTQTDRFLKDWQRLTLRTAASLRYRFKRYDRPTLVRFLRRLFKPRQPEVEGFS